MKRVRRNRVPVVGAAVVDLVGAVDAVLVESAIVGRRYRSVS